MIACLIVLGVGIISLILFLIRKCKGYSLEGTAIKAFTSVCFIAIGVISWYCSNKVENNYFGLFVILGLVFGMLGDISLELKYVFREEDTILTKLGFLTFGIGHVLYLTGIILCFWKPFEEMLTYVSYKKYLHLLLPFVGALLFIFIVIILEKPMNVKYGKMKPIVLAYSFILCLMMIMSISMAIMYKFNNWTLNLLSIGGILFTVSDLILSGTYFGQGKDRPIDLISNTAIYYFAQFAIAFSILMMAM